MPNSILPHHNRTSARDQRLRVGFVETRGWMDLFGKAIDLLPDWDCRWLVQNHAFAPRQLKGVTLLPYPKTNDLRRPPKLDHFGQTVCARVATVDRFVNYYDITSDHLPSYYQWAESWLDSSRPELIIGEVSTFIGHMVALLAAERKIPFLMPGSSRYPTGRFCFFLGERQVSIGGNPTSLDDSSLAEIAKAIGLGAKIPDYMTKSKDRKLDWALYRAQLLLGWAGGERYRTRSPLAYRRTSHKVAQTLRAWEGLAVNSNLTAQTAKHSNYVVLYPLQMQPEVNLDLWGEEFKDQVATIEELSRVIGLDGIVLVKPNPKPNQEMTQRLLEVVRERPNVVALSSSIGMREITPLSDLIVTATGTIAIEAVMRCQPVAILSRDHANRMGVPCLNQQEMTLSDLNPEGIERVISAMAEVEPTTALRNLFDTSYPGLVGDPHYEPRSMEPANIQLIASAMRHVAAVALKN